MLQDFTADRGRLLSVVAKLAAGDRRRQRRVHGFRLHDFTIDRKLAALRAAVKMLAGLNEKKALVYISGGLNLTGTDNQAMLRATVLDAVQAGVSIWPLNARSATPVRPALGQGRGRCMLSAAKQVAA